MAESIIPCSMQYPLSGISSVSKSLRRLACGMNISDSRLSLMARSTTKIDSKKQPKHFRYPRRSKLPPDPGISYYINNDSDSHPSKAKFVDKDKSGLANNVNQKVHDECDGYIDDEGHDGDEEEEDTNIWDQDEIEAISSLFQGRIPQKPGKLDKVRPLPLPLPHKLRPVGLPTSKRHVKLPSSLPVSSRASALKQVYKNPDFLIGLAREIRSLPKDEDVSSYLDKLSQFLRKGSLSLTIRELGHMGLPGRALQVFCWAQKQPQLFPDDRVLASTVEVLARNRDLKVPFNLEKLTNMASPSVIEAMVKGLIKGGSSNLAWKLIMVAKNSKRVLDPSIYAKLILELGKNRDKEMHVLVLLNELGERDDMKLSQQDCTSIMKVCTKLGKYETVETLFNWYKESGRDIGIVMYTTVIHSRYSGKRYRDALALVWEMEASSCLFDLPAYRVAIKLFVALNDLARMVRYFSKLKESGFSPTYDIYQDVIKMYIISGRLAKCKEICKEVEMAGFKLDKQTDSLLRLAKEAQTAIRAPD